MRLKSMLCAAVGGRLVLPSGLVQQPASLLKTLLVNIENLSTRCVLLSAQAQLQGMKAERAALEAQRKAEAADSRKALAEIDFLQARPASTQDPRVPCRLNRRGRGNGAVLLPLTECPNLEA